MNKIWRPILLVITCIVILSSYIALNNQGHYLKKDSYLFSDPSILIDVDDFDVFDNKIFIANKTYNKLQVYDMAGKEILTYKVDSISQMYIKAANDAICIFDLKDRGRLRVINYNGEIIEESSMKMKDWIEFDNNYSDYSFLLEKGVKTGTIGDYVENDKKVYKISESFYFITIAEANQDGTGEIIFHSNYITNIILMILYVLLVGSIVWFGITIIIIYYKKSKFR